MAPQYLYYLNSSIDILLATFLQSKALTPVLTEEANQVFQDYQKFRGRCFGAYRRLNLQDVGPPCKGLNTHVKGQYSI